jgi:chromosome condensin MukBEF MukE localization factor
MDDQFKAEELTADYSFLARRDVQAHFADLNIALLGGRHIQTGEGYAYTLMNSYPDEFRFFYRSLYNLELKQARAENIDYYYLDFPEEGKGKLTTTDRFREMTPWEIIIALMLLNLYYDRYFEQTKMITWSQLQKEILESELSTQYKKTFFNGEVRDFYSDGDWKTLLDNFKRVFRHFDRWGWIKLQPAEEGEGDLAFLIRESIDRFGKLYDYEISQFEQFVAQANQKRSKA